MLKTKLAITIDTLIIALISFFISFIWLNKYLKNAILSFILCTFISIIVFFAIFHFVLKKHKLKNLNNLDLKKAESCFNKLTFFKESDYNNYFEKLFNCKFLKVNLYISNDKIFCIETRRSLQPYDFLIAYNYFLSQENKTLFFVCQKADTEFLKLLENSPIKFELFVASDLYNAIKSTGIYPDNLNSSANTISKFSRLKKFKNNFLSSVTRNHFKDFFISGISLITISLFIPFSIYYKIMGSVLLLLSIISIFIKNKSTIITNKINITDLTKKNDA